MGLLQAMQEHKGQRNLTLYWDIETLTYNKIAGRQKPTHYKNVVYSVAIGWDNKGVIDVEVFPSFKSFFDTFFDYADRKDTITKSRTTVSMIAHNCNKYDNHFLLHDVKYLYNSKILTKKYKSLIKVNKLNVGIYDLNFNLVKVFKNNVELAKYFNISSTTVSKYIKTGNIFRFLYYFKKK